MAKPPTTPTTPISSTPTDAFAGAGADATPAPAPAKPADGKPEDGKKDEDAGETLTIVQVNHGGLIDIQAGMSFEGTDDARRASFSPDDLHHLIPGVNFVPTALWRRALKQKRVLALLAANVPALKPPYHSERAGHKILVEGPAVPIDAPRSKMTDEEAIATVEDVLIVEFPQLGRGVALVDLLRVETRPKVQRAIQDKIDLIRTAKTETRRSA